MSPRLFFILGRPRSRTAWLANFLTWGTSSFCLHEGMLGCRSVKHLGPKLEELALKTGVPVVGDADTGLIGHARELYQLYPEARFVLLTSEPGNFDLWAARNRLPKSVCDAVHADYAEAVETLLPGGVFLNFMDLSYAATARLLWRDVLEIPAPFPQERYELLRDLKVEALESRLIERVHSHLERGGAVPESMQHLGGGAAPWVEDGLWDKPTARERSEAGA